ncbi:MAG: hypothetical protein ACOVQO_04775, partial [Limnohabitans sp.]
TPSCSNCRNAGIHRTETNLKLWRRLCKSFTPPFAELRFANLLFAELLFIELTFIDLFKLASPAPS